MWLSFLSFTKNFLYLLISLQIYLSGVVAATIPALDPEIGKLEEEFLWKKTLQVTRQDGSITSLELTHAELYDQLHRLQSALESIGNVCEEVKKVILNVSCPSSLHTIFLGLYEDKNSIGSIWGEDRPISEDTFANENIRKIIEENFKRLKRRNFCTASLTYHAEGSSDGQDIPLVLDDKPVIFISGIGNEIIRILEQHAAFANFAYVIFHEGNTNHNSISIDHFRTTLYTLYDNVPSILEEGKLKTLTSEYKKDALKLLAAEEAVKTTKDNVIKEISEYLREPLDDPEMTAVMLRLPLKLASAKEWWRQAFLAFKDKFCDSEQALRYFLHAKLEDLLADLPCTVGGLLILNLHTVMDPCQYCTNALYLDVLLRDRAGFGKKKDKYGGPFHKLYNEQIAKPVAVRKPMPHIFIFASSHKLETDGGLARRLTSGRSYPASETIDSPIAMNSSVRLYFRYNGH